MKLDKIIINPPYCKNLHLKILSHLISLYPEAEVVNLSPIRWLQDPLAEYKRGSDWKKFEDIRNKIESLDTIPSVEAQSIFRAAIWGDLGIYHLTNDAKGYEFSFKHKWFIDKVILNMKDNIENHMTPERGKCDFSRPFIKISELHGHQGQKDFYDFISPDINVAKTTKGGSCAHTVNFDTDEEANNFFYSLQTNFYKFINVCVKQSMNVPWIFAPWLGDYTHPWTDEMLYSFFGLTEEEIKVIEETMEKYK